MGRFLQSSMATTTDRKTLMMTNIVAHYAWDQVKSYLGDPLTRFLLAQSESDEDSTLSVVQAEVAGLLAEIFASSQLDSRESRERSSDIESKLCSHDPQRGMSLAAWMHYRCGGQPADSIREDDFLEAALCRLALDVYPLFLIGGRGNSSHFDVSAAMWRHPEKQAALQAMYQPEEPLMKLFPNADFARDLNEVAYDLNPVLHWSTGGGGNVQLASVPQAIMLRAPGALRSDTSALNSYIHSVRETLAVARRLAEGEPTKVPAIVGCYSLALADDLLEIALDGARFRRKTAIDQSLISDSPHEGVILEVDVNLRLLGPVEPDASNSRVSTQSDLREAESFHEDLQNRISRARLAILLASREDEVLAVGQSFISVPIPVSLSGSWSQSPLAWPMAAFHSRPLTEDDEATVKEWDQLLSEIPDGMRTGVERLLSAVSERFSPHDGFIDSVITWENLFGASTETGLRVCGSLAWVVCPDDAAARAKFFREALAIYGDRSALVHGSDKKRITASRAAELRNRSVDIAIRAMRAVMGSEELRGAKDSVERSKLVLISAQR